MARYRNALPQLSGGLFLTDGGIETTLIFHEGFDLPYFAAFDLLKDQRGRTALWDYYARYAEMAAEKGDITGKLWVAKDDERRGDFAAALRGYQGAANRGSDLGLLGYARLLGAGKGVTKDVATARRLLERVAAAGGDAAEDARAALAELPPP